MGDVVKEETGTYIASATRVRIHPPRPSNLIGLLDELKISCVEIADQLDGEANA